MFEMGHKLLPRDFSDAKNLQPRSQACAEEAFRLAAKAERMEAQSGDTITKSDDIANVRKAAETMYSKALDLQDQHQESLTKFQKAKPTIMNSIIVVVVAAEILSIPILLDNIYQMRHRGQHATLN